MAEFNYGDAYKCYPIASNTTAVFANGSRIKVHDIFNPLPAFMAEADLMFIDPPYSAAMVNSYYSKAGLKGYITDFQYFLGTLFILIRDISPHTAYVEIGKEYLADCIYQMKQLYPKVTFYNSCYYHNIENLCYVVRGSKKAEKFKLDYLDEEEIIKYICEHEDYRCIGDLCMGQGLVAVNAAKNHKKFVGTELNPKRVSVALSRLAKLGLTWTN